MSGPATEQLLELISQHTAPLRLYARQRCANPDDVVQEAFVRLCTSRPVPHDPVNWLYRVVRNLAINANRSRQRRSQHETRAATIEPWFASDPDSRLDGQAAAAAMELLPEEIRETIVLRIWCDHSFQQIAELTETSPATANRRFHAGLENLRQELGVDLPKRNMPEANPVPDSIAILKLR